MRRRSQPDQPPSFEVRVQRPGLGVVANLEVSLLGRLIIDGSQTLMSRNQVFLFLYLVSNIYSLQDITTGERTYGPDCTFMHPSMGDLEVSKLQDITQWDTSRQSNVMPKATTGHG